MPLWRSQAISLDGLLDYEEDDREVRRCLEPTLWQCKALTEGAASVSAWQVCSTGRLATNPTDAVEQMLKPL